jgi:hypothetical protein
MAPEERRTNLRDIEPIAPAPDADEVEPSATVDEVAIAGAAGSGIPAVGTIAEALVPSADAPEPAADEESRERR